MVRTARFAILTPIVEAINTVLWVKINEEVFPIRVAEETFKVGDLSAHFREAKVGVFASPSSPSTSISVVSDSLGNIYAGKQQPAAANASVVVDDLSKFKPEINVLVNPTPIVSRSADGTTIANGRKLVLFQDSRCRSEGAGRFSKPDDVEVSKPLSWEGQPARSASFSLPRPERPQGSWFAATVVVVPLKDGCLHPLQQQLMLMAGWWLLGMVGAQFGFGEDSGINVTSLCALDPTQTSLPRRSYLISWSLGVL
ncbi:hypothetical protein Ancab_030281, partial [Ancistrocladus abbreviatus]